MEWNWDYVIWSTLISLILPIWHLRRKNSYRRSKLPPGPRGWPVFGNLFDLGSFPHISLEALKNEYGPVVWLNLGSVKTMLLPSAGPVEELFKNHDLSFIDRISNESVRSHDYFKSSMFFAPYSTYWITSRRICTSELFTNKRIIETTLIRQKGVDTMLSWIEKEAEKGASSGVVVRNFVFPTFFNIIGNLTLSRDVVDPHSQMSSEFCTALSGFLECLGRTNFSDILPWLRKLDLQGIRTKMDGYLDKAVEIISGFVKERVQQRQQKQELLSVQRKDFLDVLLDYRSTGKDEIATLSEYQVTVLLMILKPYRGCAITRTTLSDIGIK